MPVSAVVELLLQDPQEHNNLATFIGEPFTESEHIKFQMTIALWEDLGSPKGLRVRVEDVWNDPNRTWGVV